MNTRADTGKEAERIACDYLLKRGMKLLSRNFSCPRGEIDLIMEDAGTTVFVEVRCRREQGYGLAAETVDARKQAKLIATANHYLQAHPRSARQPCRFDVIGLSSASSTDIHWIRDAVQA
jgi:putative endonuclease